MSATNDIAAVGAQLRAIDSDYSIGDSLQGIYVYARSITEKRKINNGALARASSILHTCDNSDVRSNSIAILPESTKVVRGHRRAVAEIISSTKSLATDSNVTVRTAYAKVFTSLVDNILSISNMIQLKNDCVALLEDPVEDIRSFVLLEFGPLFLVLQREISKLSPSRAVTELKHVFKSACMAMNLSSDETVTKTAAKNISRIVHIFPKYDLYGSAINGLSMLLWSSTNASVRNIAARGVVRCSRQERVISARDSTISNLISNLKSGDAHDRVLIVSCVKEGISVYSEERFNRMFSDCALNLARDPSPNVRLQMAKCFPRLMPLTQAHDSFQATLNLLQTDQSDEVRHEMKYFVSNASRCLRIHRGKAKLYRVRRVAEFKFFKEEGPPPTKIPLLEIMATVKESAAQIAQFGVNIGEMSWSRITSAKAAES